jgi:hypothetical protein
MNTSTAIKPAMPHARSEVSRTAAPVVTAMRVVPVAGRDSMLLNLSGAHAPYFTRTFAFRDYQRCLNYIKKVQKPIY